MFHVVIPAWGKRCVEMAATYVLPSVRASLSEAPARVIVYTDTPKAFEGVEVRSVGSKPGDTPIEQLHGTLRNIHRWTIAEAPPGWIAVLLNADIVVSRSFFPFVSAAIASGYKAVVGTALRTVVGDEPPPVGASAVRLLGWAWRNRHPIAEACVWGRGRTKFANTAIFEDGEHVVLHSVHLHPFAVLADGRPLKFKGTIDDDMLANYADEEIRYISAAEVGFAELSPTDFKMDQYREGGLLTVESMVNFGRNCKWTKEHTRNLRQPIRLTGWEAVGNSPVLQVADIVDSKRIG